MSMCVQQPCTAHVHSMHISHVASHHEVDWTYMYVSLFSHVMPSSHVSARSICDGSMQSNVGRIAAMPRGRRVVFVHDMHAASLGNMQHFATFTQRMRGCVLDRWIAVGMCTCGCMLCAVLCMCSPRDVSPRDAGSLSVGLVCADLLHLHLLLHPPPRILLCVSGVTVCPTHMCTWHAHITQTHEHTSHSTTRHDAMQCDAMRCECERRRYDTIHAALGISSLVTPCFSAVNFRLNSSSGVPYVISSLRHNFSRTCNTCACACAIIIRM